MKGFDIMFTSIIVSCVVLSILTTDSKKSIIKEEKEFKYDYNYCRNNLKHFYFNDSDCRHISKMLKYDKNLVYQVEEMMKNRHDFTDSIKKLVETNQIKL